MERQSDESRSLTRFLCVLCVLCGSLAPALLAQDRPTPTTQVSVRFTTLGVYVDSGDKPLAAWQVELKATKGDVKIVGVEGGDHKDVYHDPPYYDPAALAGGRIILASYSTADNPPKGKILVATVHLQIVGEYEATAKLVVAATSAGDPISASASIANPATQPSGAKE